MRSRIPPARPGFERVRSAAALRRMLKSGQRDFAIALRGGLISRKRIEPIADDQFEVFHGIDGSIERLPFPSLIAETNIGRALKSKALFAEN